MPSLLAVRTRNPTCNRPGNLNLRSGCAGTALIRLTARLARPITNPDQLQVDVRVARRQVELPDECRFDRGLPRDFLHVWIGSDDVRRPSK